MTHNTHDATTSNVLSWSSHSANMPSIADEEGADVDEPPDPILDFSTMKKDRFQRSTLRKAEDRQSSLLTKALQSQSDDDTTDARPSTLASARRRSMTSNVSLASTADLTSDTGFTSPARTNTPSPPLPEMRLLRLNAGPLNLKKMSPVSSTEKPQEPPKEMPPKKRCIQFACAAKPIEKAFGYLMPPRPAPMVKVPSAVEAPRRPCIKFACPSPRPASTQNTPPRRFEAAPSRLSPAAVEEKLSPATPRKTVSSYSRTPRPITPRRSPNNVATAPTKKYITANDKDLLNESSRFHEFASDGPCEDDWIRQDVSAQRCKLTINDTLTKENAIRKLAAEAEEEAELEEEEAETANDDDDDDNLDDVEQEDEDEDQDDAEGTISGYNSQEDNSDGYHTDEETGFADSDDENDEDDEMRFWTPSHPTVRLSGAAPALRRPSMNEQHSDSSIASRTSINALRHTRTQRIKIRPGTPELPDSTDFVCGTLDEDRPMEDAYISCLNARRRQKLQLIPQDIDPSFPASDPENEGDEELYNPVHHDSDENVWLHGEMEDLNHETDRSRRKKSAHASPKRFHSPPPKRHHSPPPKARGRSPPPRRLFDRQSPRRLKSPLPPQMLRSPPGSLRNPQGAVAFKELASRPGLTVTKSLPRPPALFPHVRHGRRGRIPVPAATDFHVRGAIDIVKGLEQKRARRKEKFYQKYCNRARKGQIPERKPQPGMGCVRMRELGLIMAGKIDQGNYVLSI